MIICRAKDYKELSRRAANIIAAQVIMKPDCVLGLATGSSPIGTYGQLIEWYKKGDLDFSKVSSINLDEYKGLDPENDQSYRYFMNTNFFNHVNIDKANTFVPNGLEPDSDKACKEYDEIIEKSGGVDLQLLGLGHNGHIGFNEPSDVFPCGTHCVDLTPSTIDANKRFFASEADVPRQAYTMGIRSIMLAKKIVVVISGEDKSEILKKVVCGPITPEVPASVLQLHPDVVIVADEAALSKL
ncbi:MAG: glucosamine-6-phosphate deaminase [Dorea sp.]|jgi:glucosamine-6-phosphate deaminase|nr:glucosamine-6-phosphate deaminase [Dorea sp.]